MGVVVLSMVLGNLTLPAAASKLDKKGAYMAGALIAVAGSQAFHFLAYANLAAVLDTALAGGIVALTLRVSGYRSGISEQPPAAEKGILMTLTFIPVACLVLTIVILSFYGLDREKYARVRAGLKRGDALSVLSRGT